VASARAAAEELASIGDELQAPFLQACAAYGFGAVALTEGNVPAALDPLQEACTRWQHLEAPYETARTRELIGLACRALGDEDRARLELDAAAWGFRKLGAAADLARVEAHSRPPSDNAPGGLTRREVEVLRLLAAGKTNRGIAVELILSEKTVARHVSNIFTKLGLSSRSGATAYAYEHALV
jgi:DNA-binding CsgD family transcriptional regulator